MSKYQEDLCTKSQPPGYLYGNGNQPAALGSPSLGSQGLRLVVKNTLLEFQPVTGQYAEADEDEMGQTDSDRRRSFTDPPIRSPQMFADRTQARSSSGDRLGSKFKTLSNDSSIIEETQAEVDFECCEVASDATDFDHLILPDSALPAWGSVVTDPGQDGHMMYDAYSGGYVPMTMPSSAMWPVGAPPPLMPQCAAPIGLEGQAAELSAQADAYEQAAKDCKVAAADWAAGQQVTSWFSESPASQSQSAKGSTQAKALPKSPSLSPKSRARKEGHWADLQDSQNLAEFSAFSMPSETKPPSATKLQASRNEGPVAGKEYDAWSNTMLCSAAELRAQAEEFERRARDCKAAAGAREWGEDLRVQDGRFKGAGGKKTTEFIPSPGWDQASPYGPAAAWHSMQFGWGYGVPGETQSSASMGYSLPNAWGEADWACGSTCPPWQSPAAMMPNSAPSRSAKEQSRKLVPRKNSGNSEGKPSPVMKPQASEVEKTTLSEDQWTTVMLRNLPNDYTREMLLSLLDSQGFADCYDFVYMPIDFHRKAGLGYAFVNMVTHEDAERVHRKLMRFEAWETPSQKVLDICWSEPSQGLEAHIERYRNSPVMHPDVADKFKPLLFKNGVIATFPGPTKRIRPPRLKHGSHRL